MEKFIQVFKFFLGIIDAALDDVFASVCSNHKAYTNEKKKSLGKNDFTHIPHGHNGKSSKNLMQKKSLLST